MVVVKKDSMRKGSEEKMPDPPDGGWGWVVVFASFMIHVIADGVTYTFGIFYVEFLEYYKESKGTTAWVASIMVGTTYCIGPIASGLTNKYGCRAVTIAGAILAGVGLMLSTLSPNVLFLFFSIGICTDRVADMKIASDEDASYLLSIIGISNTIGRVTLGYLSDRACVNRLWIYNVSLIICGLATALSCYAANYTLMAVYCATFGATAGAGFGLMYLPSIVSVTCYFEKKRAFATGIAVCGSGMGTFALAPLTEHLVEAYGWKGAMLIIAGLVLNCAVFGGLFRPLEAPSPSKVSQNPPRIKKPDLPKLKINSTSMSNGKLPVADESASPCTPLMFKANCNAIIEESPKKNKENMVSSDSKLTNGFLNNSKQDLSPKIIPPGYCTNPSTPSENVMNGFSKDIVLRSNGHTVDRKEDSNFRNSLMLPSEFLKRKVEGSPLSSFVCSSASLAQTNKELSQLESSSHSHTGGLLYRKDIFYSGSLVSLAKYRSNPNISYSSVPADDNYEGSSKKSRFRCCPAEIRDALVEMTDFSLLMNPIFLMFAISNFLTSIGFNVPYVYTKDRVADMKIASDEDASYLLSIIGISNTIGRVTLGYLSDRACVNRLWIYNVSLIICGLATALSCYAANYTLMAVYCATFGATAGAYVSLTSVILVDLLGLDKLTNAFGILLVFEGVSCLLGPPITGWLYDGLGSYDPGFLVSGSMIAASGLILFLVPCLSNPPDGVCKTDNSKDISKSPKVAESSA